MPELQLAGLNVHIHPGPATLADKPRAAVVLLHGFGVPGTDLISIADQIIAPEGTWFVIPEGPIDLGDSRGSGFVGARGWWETNDRILHLQGLPGRFNWPRAALPKAFLPRVQS